MAKQTVDRGQQPNDGTGDDAREAFDKVNANFDEIYNQFGDGQNLQGSTRAGAVTGQLIQPQTNTYTLAYIMPVGGTLDTVDLRTTQGTVGATILRNGSPVSGGWPANVETSNTRVTVGDAFAAGDTFAITLDNAASLSNLDFALNFTRN